MCGVVVYNGFKIWEGMCMNKLMLGLAAVALVLPTMALVPQPTGSSSSVASGMLDSLVTVSGDLEASAELVDFDGWLYSNEWIGGEGVPLNARPPCGGLLIVR